MTKKINPLLLKKGTKQAKDYMKKLRAIKKRKKKKR